MHASLTLTERALGAYLGLAVGDALGATVEFMTGKKIAATHRVHRNIVGGGWLRLKAGQVTDDTQMSLALGDALVRGGQSEPRLIADAFVAWMRRCPPDIGNTCRRGIRRYMIEGTISAPPSPDSAGNGAAMRNLPVVLATLKDETLLEPLSLAQAHITHHHPLSDAATLTLARITRRFLHGEPIASARTEADFLVAQHPVFRYAPWPGRTSGYIVDTLQTVFDAFFCTDCFEDCVIRAVNRGGDADTIGALAGQIAGACYGAESIPARWLNRLDPQVQVAIRVQIGRLLAVEHTRAAALPAADKAPLFPLAGAPAYTL